MASTNQISLSWQGGLSRNRYPASPKDWEDHRENFQELYARQRKPLRVVVLEMKRLYGFEATQRQYKRKIAQWHLEKNIKDDEMRTIVRKEKQRQREDKRSIFYVRGRWINPKKVERFADRNAIELDNQGADQPINLPAGVRCLTPDPQINSDAAGDTISQGEVEPRPAWSCRFSVTGTITSGQVQSESMLTTKEPLHAQTASWPASLLHDTNGRRDSANLPPLGFLSGLSSEVQDLPERSLIAKSTQGSPITGGYKDFLAIGTTLWGLDTNFFDHDVRLTQSAVVETNHQQQHRKISYHIPRILLPLPDILREKPVNMLYFHHFMTHTAQTLITHECPNNPFKMILPKMALSDNSLINLLLAYAALHRAALLGHPTPLNRIFFYVDKAITDLQKAISNHQNQITLAKIASTIMMASMRYSFSLPTIQSVLSSASSRTHLRAAKIMIREHWFSKPFMDDPTLAFLFQWIFRMDIQWLFRRESPESVLKDGTDRPLIFDVFGNGPWGRSDLLGHCPIQCFLGTTFPCMTRMTKAGELTIEAHKQKMSAIAAHGDINAWEPSAKLKSEALILKEDLERGATSWHSQSTCPAAAQGNCSESYGLAAVNRVFQWAALIHINRNIFGRQRSHSDVRVPVENILETIKHLYHEQRANGVFIFPLVTAGCEVVESRDRKLMIEQCGKTGLVSGFVAREVMQKLWG